MRVDVHKQIFAATNLIGSVLGGNGHCFCGEITGVYLAPVEFDEGEKKVTQKVFLDAWTPAGNIVHLYLADNMQEASQLFQAFYRMVMDPNSPNVIYLDVPAIIQEQLTQKIQEQLKEQAQAGGAPRQEDGDQPVRVMLPRKQGGKGENPGQGSQGG